MSIIVLCIVFLSSANLITGQNHTSVKELKSSFESLEPNFVLISGHRGGDLIGQAENSLEIMKYVQGKIPVIFELDLRLTKDDSLVVLHDRTIDRTTTSSGNIKDYSLQQLEGINLKDSSGKELFYNIPKFSDIIKWSKGKTILNVDVKDVPATAKIKQVNAFNAFDHVIFTVHNAKQAKEFLELNPKCYFSAFIRTLEDYEEYIKEKIPWNRILIAYIGNEYNDDELDLYNRIRANGVGIMVSTVSSIDIINDANKREYAYQLLLSKDIQVIETDFPLEVYNYTN